MLQAPMLDGLAFDVGPLAQDAGGSAEVGVRRGPEGTRTPDLGFRKALSGSAKPQFAFRFLRSVGLGSGLFCRWSTISRAASMSSSIACT